MVIETEKMRYSRTDHEFHPWKKVRQVAAADKPLYLQIEIETKITKTKMQSLLKLNPLQPQK